MPTRPAWGNPLAAFCPECGALLAFFDTAKEARAYEKTRENHPAAYCLRRKRGLSKAAEPTTTRTTPPKKRARRRR